MGQEERFPPTSLSARCGFRKVTIAGMRRNGRGVPIPAVRLMQLECVKPPLIAIGDPSWCHPSHITGHTGHVPGGLTRLSLVGNMKSRETERVEVVVAQGLLDRRVS